MKLLFILPAIIMLAACDRPTSNEEVSCGVDSSWKYIFPIYLDSFKYLSPDGENINVKVTTYDNYAKIKYGNITTTFEKVAESNLNDEFGDITITYKGNFPGSERTALLIIDGNITNKKITSYNIVFIDETRTQHKTTYHHCDPVRLECQDNSICGVPFNHKYKMPNKIERCITEIGNMVYSMGPDQNGIHHSLMINYGTHSLDIYEKDALSISKNWDYNNMKLYKNDGKLEEHEKDACEVLGRLKKFIHDTGMDSDKSNSYIELQYEMASCGDECRHVIATGNDGDFLIRLPETNTLKRIAEFGTKDSKFLSVFNPNQYAQSGYCLINVIPFKAQGKSDSSDTTYRIYCGAPEYMDYNQDYAVNIDE